MVICLDAKLSPDIDLLHDCNIDIYEMFWLMEDVDNMLEIFDESHVVSQYL